MRYDAFISYSHSADGRLAPAVQSGLQRLARPWHRRRALHVFRDETGLTVNPHLWESIAQAMRDSRFFVLLASPDAAKSPWVNQEIAQWLATNPPETLLPVLTEGTLVWNHQLGDFDPVLSSALPAALTGVFVNEPRHLDLRWARDEAQLDLRHSQFRGQMATARGTDSRGRRDDLEGEDIRLRRRALRLAWGAAVALVAVTVAALLSAGIAVSYAATAREQRREAQLHGAEARRNAEQASYQEGVANENAAEARSQHDRAGANEAQAAANADEAQRQQSLAEQNANEAQQNATEAQQNAAEAQQNATQAAANGEAAEQSAAEATANAAEARDNAASAQRAAAEAAANADQADRNAEESSRNADRSRTAAGRRSERTSVGPADGADRPATRPGARTRHGRQRARASAVCRRARHGPAADGRSITTLRRCPRARCTAPALQQRPAQLEHFVPGFGQATVAPDFKSYATLDRSGRVQLVHTEDRRVIKMANDEFFAPGATAWTFEYSGDGRRLAISRADPDRPDAPDISFEAIRTVLIDVETGGVLMRLPVHRNWYPKGSNVAVDGTGKHVAIYDPFVDDPEIQIVDTDTGVLRTLTLTEHPGDRIALSPDGTRIAVTNFEPSDDTYILRQLDTRTGNDLSPPVDVPDSQLDGPTDADVRYQRTRSGLELVISWRGAPGDPNWPFGFATIAWNADTMSQIDAIAAPVLPDGELVTSVSEDRERLITLDRTTARVRDARSAAVVAELPAHAGDAVFLDGNAGRVLAVGGDADSAHVFSLAARALPAREIVALPESEGDQVALSPDGDLFAVARGGEVHVFDARTGLPSGSFAYPGYAHSLTFDGNGERVAVATNEDDSDSYPLWEGSLLVWDTRGRALSTQRLLTPQENGTVMLAPDGTFVLWNYSELRDGVSGRLRFRVPPPTDCGDRLACGWFGLVAFTPDGTRAILYEPLRAGPHLLAVDTATGEHVPLPFGGTVDWATMSDGESPYSRSGNRAVFPQGRFAVVLDVVTEQVIARIDTRGGFSPRLSPDGTALLVDEGIWRPALRRRECSPDR